MTFRKNLLLHLQDKNTLKMGLAGFSEMSITITVYIATHPSTPQF
jgi:hypothetical protein